MIAAGNREQARATAELYRDTAREAGQELTLGQNVGMLIKLAFGDTFQEAFDYAARTYGYWYHNFFQKFGFTEVFRTAADDPNRPFDLGDERALTQRMIDSGQLLCGTAEQIRDQLADVARVYGGGELEWLVYETWGQALPDDDGNAIHQYQLSSYAAEVMPAFR